MAVKQAFPCPESSISFHVSYGETDAMGVVYYANYLHWFEKARGKFIRDHGMSYRDVEERGILLPVREARCRYVRPARYDDEVRVRVGVGQWGRASLTFVYEIYGPPDGSQLLATGETQHACVTAAGRPVAVPAWLKDLFAV
jgi:acyl-CoA thioester hydrolase